MRSIPVGKCRFSLQQLQTPLSQRENTFSGFCIEFSKCAWNLEHCEKSEDYPNLINIEIIASERDLYLNVWKV